MIEMYNVTEIIEMTPEGDNVMKFEKVFKTYDQALAYVKNRIKEFIKKDTIKFLGGDITERKLKKICDMEYCDVIRESDNDNYSYVASCLYKVGFWSIKEV